MKMADIFLANYVQGLLAIAVRCWCFFLNILWTKNYRYEWDCVWEKMEWSFPEEWNLFLYFYIYTKPFIDSWLFYDCFSPSDRGPPTTVTMWGIQVTTGSLWCGKVYQKLSSVLICVRIVLVKRKSTCLWCILCLQKENLFVDNASSNKADLKTRHV